MSSWTKSKTLLKLTCPVLKRNRPLLKPFLTGVDLRRRRGSVSQADLCHCTCMMSQDDVTHVLVHEHKHIYKSSSRWRCTLSYGGFDVFMVDSERRQQAVETKLLFM